MLGGPFTNDSKITLTEKFNTANFERAVLSVAPIQPSSSSVKFIVPAGTPDAQWDVSIDGSANHTLNAPVLWWVNGDQQRTTTPGGYTRIFGSCVYHETATLKSAKMKMKQVILGETC